MRSHWLTLAVMSLPNFFLALHLLAPPAPSASASEIAKFQLDEESVHGERNIRRSAVQI